MARLRDLVPARLYTQRLTLELFSGTEEHYNCLLTTSNTKTAHAVMGDHGWRTPKHWDDTHARSRVRSDRFANGVADNDLIFLMRLGPKDLTGELIGSVALNQRDIGAVTLPPDVGWMIGEAHMNKGYATEAARELLRWAKEDFGMESIISIASSTNPQSNKVAEKLGFVDGGQMPNGDRPGMYNILIMPGMDRVEVEEGLSILQD